MNNNKLKRVTFFFAIFSVVIFFSSTVFGGGSFSVKWGKDKEPENNQVNHTYKHKKKGGPPPHAPAYGYRAKHKYLYYPSNNVYKDTERGLYFYLKGDNWEVGASLPLPLKEGLGKSVSMELETDKPYIHHTEHVKRYPPSKFKS